MSLVHAKVLKILNITPAISHCESKTLSIPTRNNNVVYENLFLRQMSNKVIIAVMITDAFTEQLVKNSNYFMNEKFIKISFELYEY